MILVNLEDGARDKHQVLRIQLENLKAILAGMAELTTGKTEVENLERSHFQILELFQTDFTDRISPDSPETLVSYYVEINKQLRMLGADINLLKTSRLAETLHKRIHQASDRLSLLITYCDRVAEISE
jgi:hypothetical protein